MELGMCWDMPGPVGLSWLLSVALLWLRLDGPYIHRQKSFHNHIPIYKSALFHTRGRYPEFHLAFERIEGHTGCSPWSSRRI